MRICVFFVVDGPKLEAQACFLAPTLRKHLGPEVSVIAYRRQDASPIQPVTARILSACNVELRDIPNTGHDDRSPWTAPYPIGNKIMAASDPRDCDISVFIDTDTVFAAPIDFASLLGEAQIAAVISDYSTESNTVEGWTAFYGHFDLPLPADRIRLPRGRRIVCLPYFNAGLLIFRDSFGSEDRCFGAEWLQDTIRFDNEITVPFNRANLDQLTLPITVHRLGHKVTQLPKAVNFNLPAYGNMPGAEKLLIHYHRFGVLWSNPDLALPVLDALRERHGAQALAAVVDSFGASLALMRFKRLL